MFIVHLPGAYLALTALFKKPKNCWVYPAGLLGGIAPDFDLIWFYTIGQRQTIHHDYWTHTPFTWLFLAFAAFVFLGPKYRQVGMAFVLGGLVHMVLDSFGGQIAWAWPFTNATWPLYRVPRTLDPWWMSYIVHWSALIELGILMVALFVGGWRSGARSALQTHRAKPT